MIAKICDAARVRAASRICASTFSLRRPGNNGPPAGGIPGLVELIGIEPTTS
jgi:hypothetical protein